MAPAAARRQRRRTRRRRSIALAALASGMLFTASCGTRLNHSQIAADWGNGGGTSAGSAASGNGATTTNGGAGSSSSGSGINTGSSTGGSTSTTTGTSTTNGDTSATGTGPGTSGSATKSPLLIGSVGDYSGIAGASEKDGPRGLQIWAAWVNAHGGINGHPVKVYVVDDGMDAQRYQAGLRDLVENKHVIAFVDNFAPFTIQAGVKYLEDKHVPLVGGDCAEYVWNQSPMLFPQCPGYVDGLWDIVRVATLHGVGKNFGSLICSEASACTNTKTEWYDHGLAKSAGMNPVYEGDISVGQPNFTAECLDAKNSHVQVFAVVADVNTVARVVHDCSLQQFNPQYLEASGTMDAHLASLPGMQGSLVQLNAFPWTVSNNAGVNAFLQAVRTYAPDQPLTPTLSQGWLSGLVFALAAAHVGDKPTSAEILQGLWTVKNNSFGGLGTPLTFVANKPAPSAKCSFWMKVENGQMVAPQGLQTICRS